MKDLKRTNMERSPGADPSVTMLLRAAYTPPEADGYWEGLEGRIMARVRDAVPEPTVAWWAVIAEWRGVGLVAATLALLLTGATIMRELALEASAGQLAASAAYLHTDGRAESVPVAITIKGKDSLPDYDAERFLNPFNVP